MSMDLYQDTLVERVGNLTPTTEVEPGAFDGFLRGTGMATMRGFAQTARTAGMVGSVLPVLADKAASAISGQESTVLGDRYFKAIDENLGSAVDYWTPRPNEVGVAGQVVGSLLSVLPQAIASPPLVALQAADIGTELVGKGVSAGKAAAVAGTMTAGMMAGIWMPILGNNLWQRTLVGGAGFNLAQGVASRGAAELILAGLPEAEQFKAFDPEAMTLDALLGMAFGSFAHISPEQRAAGKQAWDAIGKWAQGFSPSEVAATATLRTAQHLNTDSTPGIPVGTQDIDAHVTRMRTAIDQLVRGEDVDVENVKVPAAEGATEGTIGPEGETIAPDPETVARRDMGGDPLFVVDADRRAEQLRNAAELLAEAQNVRREESLPRVAEAPLTVPADITGLPHDLQALHIGEAVSLRLRALEMDAEQAQAHGAIWSAFFKTAAEKYGVAPADLLERYGVDVQRMSSADNLPQALEQAGRRAAAEPKPIADADRLTLEHDTIRSMIQSMADEEAGWAQIGGRLDRARLLAATGDTKLGTPAFTTWIPKQEWWLDRPGHPGRGLNETQVRGAVRKALAGEKMTKLERDTVDHMVDVLNDRLAAERELGDDRWNEVGEAVVQEGLEPTTDNVMDAHLLARAVAIDKPAVEAAAAKYVPTKDVAGMMAEARRIVREHEEAQRGQENAAGQPGDAAARGGQPPGEETLYQRDEPGTWYYSELARQLDAAQIKSAPAKGWTDYLKSLPQKGVKAEEIKWSGLEEWLALQEGKVTKEQVTEFLKQGGVRVDEVMLGGKGERTPMDAAIANDVTMLKNTGFEVEQDPTGAGRWGVMEMGSGEIFVHKGDADEWRESHQDLVANTTEPGDLTDVPPAIPDNVVDAIDRVLDHLNGGSGVTDAHTMMMRDYLVSRGWNPETAEQYARAAQVGDATAIGDLEANVDAADYDRLLGPYHQAPPTKFGSYQLPGGENYRELLLTLPNKPLPTELPPGYEVGQNRTHSGVEWRVEGPNASPAAFGPTRERAIENFYRAAPAGGEIARGPEFTSSHFDEPNIAAHVRFNERTDADGKRVLFLEEIQSDWAQQGRKQGFAGEKSRWTILTKDGEGIGSGTGKTAEEAIADWQRVAGTRRDLAASAREEGPSEHGVPAGPFVQKTEAWAGLAMKRMIRYAAAGGFDKIAWTRGQQQVERYTSALRKAVDVIEWEKTKDGIHLVGFKGSPGEEGARLRHLERLDAGGEIVNDSQRRELDRLRAAHKAQKTKVVDTTEKETALSDAIGKAMAEKIISDPGQKGTIEGADIKVDDTGMAGFYDRMLPSIAKDVLKKLGGGKVGDVQLDTGHLEHVTPGMHEFTPGDYGSFGGAEDFPDGSKPVTGDTHIKVNGEDSPIVVVADANGIELFPPDGDEGLRVTWNRLDSSLDVRNQAVARELIRDFWPVGSELWRIIAADHPGFTYGPGVAPGKVGVQPGFDITHTMRERALAGQPLFQRGAQAATPPRGSITFGEGRTLIAMFETANASTFAHETGHLWLQMTRDLASREGVPPEAAADWATLASWLKIEGGEIPREAHEQFARGWEKYLQEGVAPNEGLRGVFQRFRDWLLEVYRNLTTRGLDVELTDEVRGVMARMLESQARDPSQTAQEAPGATRAPVAPEGGAAPTMRQGAQTAPAQTESAPPGEIPAQAVSSSSGEGGGATPGGPAAETPDMVATEAHRIAAERPDLRIRVGTDEEGGAIYQTASDFLEAAKAEAAQARDDKRLITAAAECLLGTV